MKPQLNSLILILVSAVFVVIIQALLLQNTPNGINKTIGFVLPILTVGVGYITGSFLAGGESSATKKGN